MFFCNFCKERWFEKKSGRSNTGECTDYEKARKDPKIDCRKLAKDNDMDPYQDGFPCYLPKLSKVEEMLIAHVYHVIKTYCLKGGMIGYKVGHKDFRVKCQVIQQWLTFLHANNPLYAGINIDFNLLSQLPEDISVEDEVNIVEGEELGQNAENISASARETN
eukprot:7991336-Ditylum_brightwellii.AAC.1